jgi:hypothetical protein
MEVSGYTAAFQIGQIKVHKGNEVLAVGNRDNKLYKLTFKKSESNTYQCSKGVYEDLWHKRYAHLGNRNL